ncbi:hypothetical protein B0T17DRAFT_488736 [Bombardia bombarda]|uniref:NAD(P)-binding protein n=1 Tax=Bombardia bombarda TaxID=252184 RepID=A0AA39X8X7_9PEZI|nr:hypothetical protein B0T17DRAFT_488736 [Bombardia bombarda]
MAPKTKTALVTGCSEGGLGWAIAIALQAQGYHVFATLRNMSKAGTQLSSLANVEILPLDVTVPESVKTCAAEVAKRTGGSLDVLVNNAGADFVMPLLDVDVAEAKALYDLNVWSILSMSQAFAPQLIKAGGLVCNIISVVAVLNLAYSGIYTSSKAAASRISETLRIEMAPLGVKVQTQMVGAVHTPIHVNSGELVLPEKSYYRQVFDVISAQRKGDLKAGSQPAAKTAKNIVSDIVNGRTGQNWRGGLASAVWFVTSFLPGWLIQYLASANSKLDTIPQPAK